MSLVVCRNQWKFQDTKKEPRGCESAKRMKGKDRVSGGQRSTTIIRDESRRMKGTGRTVEHPGDPCKIVNDSERQRVELT